MWLWIWFWTVAWWWYVSLFAQELENLRDSLEESVSSTAAQQEIRAQRENELAQFKRTLEEETANHEATVASMRQKHAKAIEDLNDQLEAARKVGVWASMWRGGREGTGRVREKRKKGKEKGGGVRDKVNDGCMVGNFKDKGIILYMYTSFFDRPCPQVHSQLFVGMQCWKAGNGPGDEARAGCEIHFPGECVQVYTCLNAYAWI